MNRIGIAAWLVATLLSVWIATQAVAVVREEVTQPRVGVTASTLGAAATSSPPTTAPAPITTVAAGPTTSQTPNSSTSTAAPTTTAGSAATAPDGSTTVAPATTSAPTTTAAPPSTTSSPQVQTHRLVGGWVRIVIGDGTVSLDGAAPYVGFTMNIERDGPREVRVDFESQDSESEFKAQWEDGELVVELHEDD